MYNNQITCCGINFPISNSRNNYAQEYKEYINVLLEQISILKNKYNKYGNCDKFIDEIDFDINSILECVTEYYTKKWNNKGYMDLTPKNFFQTEVTKFFDKLPATAKLIDELSEHYFSLIDSLDDAKEYRKFRKDNRTKVSAFGYNLGSYTRASANAALLNGITGIGAGLKNAVGNSIDKIAVTKEKKKLYKNPNTLNSLITCLQQDLYCILLAHLTRKQKYEHIEIEIPSNEATTKAYSIIENIQKNELNETDLKKYILQAYNYSPYVIELYYTILNRLFKDYSPNNTYNDYNGLYKLSNFFGLSNQVSQKLYDDFRANYHTKLTAALQLLKESDTNEKRIKELNSLLYLKKNYLSKIKSFEPFHIETTNDNIVKEIEENIKIYTSIYPISFNQTTNWFEHDAIYEEALKYINEKNFERAMEVINNSTIPQNRKEELKQQLNTTAEMHLTPKLIDIEENEDFDENEKKYTIIGAVICILIALVLYKSKHNILGSILLFFGISNIILHVKTKKDIQQIEKLNKAGYNIKINMDNETESFNSSDKIE